MILHLSWEAVLLQAMLKQGWATFDICRNLIVPPDGYDVSVNGIVTRRMKWDHLIVQIGMSVSCRAVAKCETTRIWKMVSKNIARSRLRDLQDELGEDLPRVKKKTSKKQNPGSCIGGDPRGNASRTKDSENCSKLTDAPCLQQQAGFLSHTRANGAIA